MGKPYEMELSNLNQTYQWALKVPIKRLCSFINASHDIPLVAVGSGGSLTAAHMAALLHQRTGMISKGVTPLDFISSRKSIQDTSVLVLSAGGRNSDILSAFRFAAICEPRQLMALCMRTGSPLERLSKEFRYTCFLDFDLPSGKDGFLATNSLLAFITILIRAYKELLLENYDLPKNLPSTQAIQEQLNVTARLLLDKDTWVVLYGGWGLPAAVDTESKFTEAALRHVQVADYRNFAHGRHHWLAKRGVETGVVALITPDEERIAERTLNLIPENIPSLQLTTDRSGPIGGLDLLIKVLHLVYLVGIERGIDPGMPHVPAFGRRIYHLRLSPNDSNVALPSKIDRQGAVAIQRKSKCLSLADMDGKEFEYWRKAYKDHTLRLRRTSFGAAVFDYDGTLCDLNERYTGPSQEIGREFARLLKGGIIIGIATGRGKSVRIALQNLIHEEYWEQVIIGYYNGSDIASLKEKGYPDKIGMLHLALQSIQESLSDNQQFCCMVKCEWRPKQITVEPINVALWKKTRLILLDTVAKANVPGVRVLESSHSIDVIAPGVSKLNLVEACEQAATQIGNPEVVLCTGDKGEWPGNDYELLSTPYSISVDTVSSAPESCWNLSKSGHRGVQATLEYLKRMEVSDGVLRFRQKGGTKTQ